MKLEYIRNQLLELLSDLRRYPSSREISLAMTKLEEVIHRINDRIDVEKDIHLTGDIYRA